MRPAEIAVALETMLSGWSLCRLSWARESSLAGSSDKHTRTLPAQSVLCAASLHYGYAYAIWHRFDPPARKTGIPASKPSGRGVRTLPDGLRLETEATQGVNSPTSAGIASKPCVRSSVRSHGVVSDLKIKLEGPAVRQCDPFDAVSFREYACERRGGWTWDWDCATVSEIGNRTATSRRTKKVIVQVQHLYRDFLLDVWLCCLW